MFEKGFAMSYEQLAEAFAFCGNSLLAPMTQTSSVGLDPSFWRNFPTFDDERVAAATEGLAQWAEGFVEGAERNGADPALICAVEYTQLFVGPPSPAAAPWETMHRAYGQAAQEVTVGFGEPTFEMRGLLRELGLELSNENRQYEDHMGIELLYLSELCRRRAASGECDGEPWSDERIVEFVHDHLLAWIDAFASRVREAAPDGYFERLLALIKALLEAIPSESASRL